MLSKEQIEIPLSKVKLTLMLAGSIAFMAIGLWLVLDRPVSPLLFLGSPAAVSIVGVCAIIFFGLCALFIAKKITDNAPGLIINNEGLTDNSSGVSAGLILWTDVKEIKKKAFNQSFIIIILKNPQEYIDRKTSGFQRRVMEVNYKSYGSPINISANGLKCNFNNLYSMITNQFKNSPQYLKP